MFTQPQTVGILVAICLVESSANAVYVSLSRVLHDILLVAKASNELGKGLNQSDTIPTANDYVRATVCSVVSREILTFLTRFRRWRDALLCKAISMENEEKQKTKENLKRPGEAKENPVEKI